MSRDESWDSAVVETIERSIAQGMETIARRPFILGICGAQGCGKSTLAKLIETRAIGRGQRVATLSIDDLYLSRATRAALAKDVHPLLQTRGVPGTHDVGLGLAVIERLGEGEATPLPRFDKGSDDVVPRAEWPWASDKTDLLVLEGWCVGAAPQEAAALLSPVNLLERDEDGNGIWRRFVNEKLAGIYQTLFDRIDRLVLLAAPSFEVVLGWRTQQEHALRAASGAGMSDNEIGRFISHYQRLTEHILAEMPARADIVIPLSADRRPIGQAFRFAR